MTDNEIHIEGPVPSNGEFRFVSELLGTGKIKTRDFLGISDDAALDLDGGERLVSVDAFVEEEHFRLDWSTPRQVVNKVFVAALSDINACGGTADRVYLALGVGKNWNTDILEEVRKSLAFNLGRYDLSLMGGDTVRSPMGFFSLTVMGSAPERVLKRSVARPGQDLFVSGTLGGSAAGLKILEQGDEDRLMWPGLLRAHLAPEFPRGLGEKLSSCNATGACMDISDGLGGDLLQLAGQSSVKIILDPSSLPLAPDLEKYCKGNRKTAQKMALNSGEEFQLVFTMDSAEAIFFRNGVDFPLSRIGCIAEGEGVYQLDDTGACRPLHTDSWSHL